MPDPVIASDGCAQQNGLNANGRLRFSGPEFTASVERSLIRAAKNAHLEAYLADEGVAYDRDGVFGIYKPDPAMYEDLIPPDMDRSRIPPQFEDEQIIPDVPTTFPQEILDGLRALANNSRPTE
ncbi:hypothetical protein [Candidatus Poriferisodalis sp.]|uniref:hypothetical protein n=1 Tax=Candidatus Poriferisodalis sp. TaxID=3101277 RepID=UPI003AF76ED5